MKKCSQCKESKPNNEFHKDISKKDGFATQCKRCCSEKVSIKNHSPNYDGSKLCRPCMTVKPRTDFYLQKRNKDGLTSMCKSCVKEYDKGRTEDRKKKAEEWRNLNPSYNQEYYQNNKDRLNKKSRGYHHQNKESQNAKRREHYKKNKDMAREVHKRWMAENPEKVRAAQIRRRARLRGADGSHTGQDIKALKKLQKNRCAYCLCCVKDNYHVDHIVAIANGGSNNPDNLQILCPTCNISKRDKCPIKFAQERGLLI